MTLAVLKNNRWAWRVAEPFWRWDAARKSNIVRAHMSKGSKVLDIGAGFCFVSEILESHGYDTTALDIENLSVTPLQPRVYDGRHIPYEDDSFDVALLLTVLHHTRSHDQIVSEARRVAKRLIIIEDVYESRFQKRLTHLADSLINFEFKGHPHSNRRESSWSRFFERHGLNVNHAGHRRLAYFKQGVYVLDRMR